MEHIEISSVQEYGNRAIESWRTLDANNTHMAFDSLDYPKVSSALSRRISLGRSHELCHGKVRFVARP